MTNEIVSNTELSKHYVKKTKMKSKYYVNSFSSANFLRNIDRKDVSVQRYGTDAPGRKQKGFGTAIYKQRTLAPLIM